MPALKDRTNDRYGRLKVLSHAGKDHRNKHLWLCLCDCGNEKIVVSDNLSSGKSKSCGCLRNEILSRSGNQYEPAKNREHAIIRLQYSRLRKRNKKLGHDEIMPLDLFERIVKSKCHYCNIEHSKEIYDRTNEKKDGKKISDHILKCNGIDRVDSKKGYTKDNSVPCCTTCNFAKNSMQENEFYEWVKRIYNNLLATDRINNHLTSKNNQV